MKKLTTFLLLIFTFQANAQHLLKDIANGTASTLIQRGSYNTSFVKDDTLYYLADNSNNPYLPQMKIWFTVGGSNDAQDLFPNVYYTADKFFYFKNKFYILQYSGNNNSLSSFDRNGNQNFIATYNIGDAYNTYNIQRFFIDDDKFYFYAYDYSLGDYYYKLWSGDGNAMNLLHTFHYGGIDNTNVIFLNHELFFSAYTVNEGSELWQSDGTAAGTTLLKDIFPGTASSNISYLTVVNSKFYFSAGDYSLPNYSLNTELWECDGTAAGTHIINYNHPAYVTKFSNNVAFNQSNPSPNITKIDLNNYNNPSFIYLPSYNFFMFKMFEFKNDLYFIQNVSSQNSYELWRIQENQSPQFIKTVASNLGYDSFEIFSGSNKFMIQQKKSFINNTNNSENDIIISDGTPDGTKSMAELNPTLKIKDAKSAINAVGDNFYFLAYQQGTGYELWRTDGTVNGTSLVKDANTLPAASNPELFLDLGTKTVFMANDIEHGREFWTTDGTMQGTNLALDLTQYSDELFDISSSSTIDKFDVGIINNKLIYGNKNDYKVYAWDGGNSPKVISPTSMYVYGTNPYFTPIQNKLYFRSSNNSSNGSQLWATDGTLAGTTAITNLNFSTGGCYPHSMAKVNNSVIFFTTQPNSVWKTDLTTGNVSFIYDFGYNNYTKFENYDGIVLGDKYVVPVVNWLIGGKLELWTATENSVSKISSVEIQPFAGKYQTINGVFYFLGINNYAGEIWRTDGTAAGTYRIQKFNYFPTDLLAFNNNLYFTYQENGTTSLWKTDGSVNGATKVIDFGTNYENYSTLKVKINDNKFILELQGQNYFYNNEQLWISDGTASGTKKVITVRQGNGRSISEFYVKDNKLYFGADDGINGKELWIMDFSCPNQIIITENLNSPANYISGGSIESSNLIKSTSKVIYQASNSILIKPGEKIENGATFSAQISGCSN